MQGREGDLFYRGLARESIDKQLEVMKRLGFSGIYIDQRGFNDRGKELIDRLTTLLDSPPTLVRRDGQVVFFRIKPDSGVDLNGLSASKIMQRSGYMADQHGARYRATLAEGIDFRRSDLPIFVKNVTGLSVPESGGRWSDANLAPSVRIDFGDPLPGTFTLEMSLIPFGPNAGKTLTIRIGSQTHFIKIPMKSFVARLPVDLAGEKVFSIELQPPQPTSPAPGDRKLGLAFVFLRVLI